MDFSTIQSVLLRAGITIDTGLTTTEFAAIEAKYGVSFPDDLREFLSIGLPMGKGWPDWRLGDEKTIGDRLMWPLEGIYFDIKHNVVWLEEWGQKPDTLDDAFAIARRAFEAAPMLIPVCGHRFIPSRPSSAGNPVFSVWQTDIIYYGVDLLDYLQNEFAFYFGRTFDGVQSEPARKIEFWTRLVDINNGA